MSHVYTENKQVQSLLDKYSKRIKISELTEAVNRGMIDQDQVERAIKSGKLESIK